jgi:hypothetical protein
MGQMHLLVVGETVVNIMKEQSFFGEIGVLFSIPRYFNQVLKHRILLLIKGNRTVSCRSRGRSIILILTKENLQRALEPYPQISHSISQIAEERYSNHCKYHKEKVEIEFGEELQVGITQNELKSVSFCIAVLENGQTELIVS